MVSFEYLFDVVAQVHWPIYIVMYIFLFPFALAADLNELAGR